jgi:hypothetical protein
MAEYWQREWIADYIDVHLSTCQCGQRVIWAKYELSGSIQLDFAPHENGNIILLQGGFFKVLSNRERTEATATERYRIHGCFRKWMQAHGSRKATSS